MKDGDNMKILLLTGGFYHNFLQNTKLVIDFIKKKQLRFDFEVTDDLSHLNSTKLKDKAIIVVYTLLKKLNEYQEKVLLNFVEKGGGFLGLHSANASFMENKKYIDMVGSKFLRHPPKCTFKVKVSKMHYITLGIDDFEIEDELYISKYDKNINILLEAVYKERIIPICYTKSYGLGKIVYLSLGHDEKSILNDSFKEIFIRSLNWLKNEMRWK